MVFKIDSECYFSNLLLERRVIYDYEKYGDSPACLGKDKDLDGQVALVQGFGITEDGTPPDGILEANVTIISNSQCEQEMSNLKSKYGQEAAEALPDGPTDAVLCTKGIWNKKKSVFTVSVSKAFQFTLLEYF